MPSRSARTPQATPEGWESLPLPKDVAEWLILRAENSGMPRATIMREAVEAYKRSLEPIMGRTSGAQAEREGALRARIAALEADLKAARSVAQVDTTTAVAG